MKTLVLFDSKFGNTEQIARAIGAALEQSGSVDVRSISEMAQLAPGIELLVVGGPTQAHGVNSALKTFLDGLPPEALRGTAAAAFDTRLRWPVLLSGSAARGIAERLERKGARLVAKPESFYVEHGEGPLADGEVARAESWARQVAGAILGVA